MKAIKNQVDKLFLREVRGSLQPHSRSNPVRFFTKYSQNCCFKLSEIMDAEGEIRNGHVILGFTKDGTCLISYSLVIDTRLELPQPIYTYMLHWWKFSYSKPLVKIYSTHLFYMQTISHSLHLIVSQSLDEKQVIVWGRGPTSQEEQSPRCYVTICAAPPNKPCPKCKTEPCLEHSYSAHFVYDSLPPYPVFLPSTSLQIPGTVFFNSGDALVAFKCVPCSNNSELESAMYEFTHPSQKIQKDLPENVLDRNKLCEAQNTQSQIDSGRISNNSKGNGTNLREERNKENCGDTNNQNHVKDNIICKDIFALESKNHIVDEGCSSSVSGVSSQSSTISLPQSCGTKVNPKDYVSDCLTVYSYRRYTPSNVQDNPLNISDEDINHEVPAVVIHGTEELESSLCSENYSTTTSTQFNGPSVLVCQAFLDMEQCINDLIESHEDLRYRYKSLRDYDSQVLSVCNVTGDVIVMVKVLVYAKPIRSTLSDGLQVSPCPVLQQTGFIFSWNVWNGSLQTLSCLETLDQPHRKSFAKSMLECTRSLRENVTVPAGFSAQVRVFSNYTVFIERSLKYLIHPFLPIIIIL